MAAGINRNKYQMDMCHGPLMKQIVTFAVPFVFSGLLQIFFHAADLMVVGRFSSHRALAAVGATGSLTMLIINIFLGISIGTNVMVSRYLGERNRKEVSRTVHTAVFSALAGGVLLAFIGIAFSRIFLQWMGTPDDVIDMSVLYMRIYFAGMPFIMLYNYGSSIMRAAGDSRRPFYFLVIGGILNVLLNLFFVLVCGMDVGGVALATIISTALSSFMVIQSMKKMTDGCRFRWKKIGICWKNLREMLYIGVPAGISGSCFSLANILIQSSINSFGSEVMAGNTAATQWEGFLFVSSTALGHTMVSFVSQNLGGKQYKRIRESIRYGILFTVCINVFFSIILFVFHQPLLAMFNADPEVIKYGFIRFSLALPFQWACAIMEIETGALRGLGLSIGPTLIMIFGVCIFRIIWIETVFRYMHSLNVLLASFPISWVLVVLAEWVMLSYVLRKYPLKNME